MSNFFSETLKVADEKTCYARWFCGKPGEYFRCGFCGYRFVVGDKYRLLYTNDIANAPGNPIVCEKCNDTTQSLRDKWRHKWVEWNRMKQDELWFFTKFLK